MSVGLDDVFVPGHDRAARRRGIDPGGHRVPVVVGHGRIVRTERASSGAVAVEAGDVAVELNEALAVEARRLPDPAGRNVWRSRGAGVSALPRRADCAGRGFFASCSTATWVRGPLSNEIVGDQSARRAPTSPASDVFSDRSHSRCARANIRLQLRISRIRGRQLIVELLQLRLLAPEAAPRCTAASCRRAGTCRARARC